MTTGLRTVEQFLDEVSKAQITSRYSVSVISTGYVSKTNMLCSSVSLPSATIDVEDDATPNTIGNSLPREVSIEEFDCTFICDAKGETYKYFKEWVTKAIFFKSQSKILAYNKLIPILYINDYDSYIADIHIQMYDQFGQPSQHIIAKKCFPVSIQPGSLDWNTTELLTMTVTFNCTYLD